MYKGKLELAKIGDIQVSMNVILKNDPSSTRGEYTQQPISTFQYNGNTYLSIRPHPYITLAIIRKEDKKSGNWSKNSSINLNRFDLYKFINRMKKFEKYIDENEDEIYDTDRNGNYIVYAQVMQRSRLIIYNTYRKAVLFQPCIIPDEEVVASDDAMGTKGILFAINDLSEYACITVEEFSFLIHILQTTDLSTLTMQLVNTYIASTMYPDKIDVQPMPETQTDTAFGDGKELRGNFFQKPSTTTIPDI